MKLIVSVYDYDNNKLAVLKSSQDSQIEGEIYNIRLTEDANGQFEFNFVLPLYVTIQGQTEENYRWSYIVSEYKIKVEYDTFVYWFKIKSTNDNMGSDGKLLSNVQCKSLSYELNKKNTELILVDKDTATNLVTQAITGTGWTIGTIDSFDGKELTINQTSPSNALNLLNEIALLFDGKLEFDTDAKTVSLTPKDSGRDTLIDFRVGKNIKSLEREVSGDEIVTRLYVRGGEIDTGAVGIQEINPTREPYIDNFSYYVANGMINSTKEALIDAYNTDMHDYNVLLEGYSLSISNASNSISSTTVLLNVAVYEKNSKVKRVAEIDSILTVETNPTKIGLLNSEKSTLNSQISSLNSIISGLEDDIDDLESDLASYQSSYDTTYDLKKTAMESFQDELGDFIHEGVYTNANLIEAQSVYDDGVEVLSDLCIPKVFYKINLLDLSSISGYEMEKIRLHDLVLVNDPFLKISTKVRITKIERDLVDLQNTTVEVANFYTGMEELLKDISRNVDTIKKQQQYWDRTPKAVNPDGSINSTKLQKTLSDGTYTIKNGVNDSITSDGSGIILQNIYDTNKIVRINGDVIESSLDGGITWEEIVNSRGSNIAKVFGGVLEVSEVYLKGNTSFFWNGDGFFAIDSTNSNKWIKFNDDGFFFTLNNGSSYELSLTWAGLQIGTHTLAEIESGITAANNAVQKDTFYNRVKISTANGIQVYDNQAVPVDRVKIGQIDATNYGMQLKYPSGAVSQETLSDGSIRTYDDNGNVVMDSNGLNSLQIAGYGIIEGLRTSISGVSYDSSIVAKTITADSTYLGSGDHRININTTGVTTSSKLVFNTLVGYHVENIESVYFGYVIVDNSSWPAIGGLFKTGQTLWVYNGTTSPAGCTASVTISTGKLTRPNGEFFELTSSYTISNYSFKVPSTEGDGIKELLIWIGGDGVIRHGEASIGSGSGIMLYPDQFGTTTTFVTPRATSIGGYAIDPNAIVIAVYFFGWGLGLNPPQLRADLSSYDRRPITTENDDYSKLISSTAMSLFTVGIVSSAKGTRYVHTISLDETPKFAIVGVTKHPASAMGPWSPNNTKNGATLFIPLRLPFRFGSWSVSPSGMIMEYFDDGVGYGYLVSPTDLDMTYMRIERAWLEDNKIKIAFYTPEIEPGSSYQIFNFMVTTF